MNSKASPASRGEYQETPRTRYCKGSNSAVSPNLGFQALQSNKTDAGSTDKTLYRSSFPFERPSATVMLNCILAQ